ncbi:hypothetical protein THF1C08_320028 [Vibrio jasicida]|uniref:Lipoprotein n=1 Tax=Vibrio jasicida TaxID=766224 RepID=A0AAU9QSJ6_9VIBR|nr:hypothetical protein THF1C08_320028 [Vibrio jasicida]CAH1597364.1 hypothetical protein THF1A12_320028 [Vibrio jasicida]
MKKFVLSLLIGTLITGCDPVKIIRDQVEVAMPTQWMVHHGEKVDIGGEVVAIVGTDKCFTAFGTYPCWKYSLIGGDKQLVTLSNGIQEIWTTVENDNDSLSLVRPNGFVVVAAPKTGCSVKAVSEPSENGKKIYIKAQSIECALENDGVASANKREN